MAIKDLGPSIPQVVTEEVLEISLGDGCRLQPRKYQGCRSCFEFEQKAPKLLPVLRTWLSSVETNRI